MKSIQIPDESLLTDYLDNEIWDIALAQANRSPMIRFRTGAAIYDIKNEIVVGVGCSHNQLGSQVSSLTTHAEIHAIRDSHADYRFEDNGFKDCICCIVTIGRSGGWTRSSRPCMNCAIKLSEAGILAVVYAELCNDGTWIINWESPNELTDRFVQSNLNHALHTPYARFMRIPDKC